MNNKFLMVNVNTLRVFMIAKCLLLLCTIKLYLVAVVMTVMTSYGKVME